MKKKRNKKKQNKKDQSSIRIEDTLKDEVTNEETLLWEDDEDFLSRRSIEGIDDEKKT